MIYIAIGSNLGNRLYNIRRAIDILQKDLFTTLKTFPILETEALLESNAPIEWKKPFLNTIVAGESSISPEELLKKLKAIEAQLGRPLSYQKWAPRIIDLDILLYNDMDIQTPSLTIPHKELCNRPFLMHLLKLADDKFPAIEFAINRALSLKPQLVGIVNITPDSFSDGGKYFAPQDAIDKALGLDDDGASFVELGAQSTRPGATIIDEDEEYQRLVPVLDGLKASPIQIILDSFYPFVIRNVLKNYTIAGINDVKGDLDDKTLVEIANKNCKFITMHSLSVPAKLGEYLNEKEPSIDKINLWIEKKVNKLLRLGFQRDNIILDPGIGFGKSHYQNLSLIKAADQIKNLGCKVMFGHSRKSYISAFHNSKSSERDLETIAISDYLNQTGIDYLRVHNVKDHQRFFVAKQMMAI